MSYYTQALLAADQDMLQRVTACAARESIPDPAFWASQHAWQYSALPGWDDAYQYAINAGNEHPGRDSAVITDGQILAGVQNLREADDGDQ